MLLLTLLSLSVIGKELKITNENSKVFFEPTVSELEFKLRIFENKDLIIQENNSINIDLSVIHLDKQDYPLCMTQPKQLVFDEYTNHEEKLISGDNQATPQLNDPSYFLSSPILSNLVHVNGGFVAVTTDYKLIIFNVTESNESKTGFVTNKTETIYFGFLRFHANETEIPQIVYEPINKYIFIVYKEQVISGFVDLTSGNVSKSIYLRDLNIKGGIQNDRKYIGTVRVAHQHLFVPLGLLQLKKLIQTLGSYGLNIYRVESNGDLKFIENLNKTTLYKGLQSPPLIFIIDVAIGGQFGEDLYILDYNSGVIPMKLQKKDNLSYRTNVELGFISTYGCKIIKEFNEKSLFILCERYTQIGQNSYLVEIGLFLQEQLWFRLKTHFLLGRYFDIDVTDKFAILRGVDAHRIIFHSIWQGFQPTYDISLEDDSSKQSSNAKDENYVYIPHLQSLKFFSQKFGFGDPKSWHFNLTHSFILGITTHQIVEIPWLFLNPKVRCQTSLKEYIGKQFDYQIVQNHTNCKEKEEFLVKIFIILITQQNQLIEKVIPPQLMVCQQKQIVHISLIEPITTKYNTKFMEHWMKFLVIVLIIVAIILFFTLRKFKKKKIILDNEISGFENKTEASKELDTSMRSEL